METPTQPQKDSNSVPPFRLRSSQVEHLSQYAKAVKNKHKELYEQTLRAEGRLALLNELLSAEVEPEQEAKADNVVEMTT